MIPEPLATFISLRMQSTIYVSHLQMLTRTLRALLTTLGQAHPCDTRMLLTECGDTVVVTGSKACQVSQSAVMSLSRYVTL